MADDLELHEEQREIELVEKEQKFSFAKFAVGWAKIVTSKFFLAFAVSTWFVTNIVFDHQTDDLKKLALIIWAAITVVWLLAEAWLTFISRGSLNVEAKFGASLDKKTVFNRNE
jgi:hypothetical protein